MKKIRGAGKLFRNFYFLSKNEGKIRRCVLMVKENKNIIFQIYFWIKYYLLIRIQFCGFLGKLFMGCTTFSLLEFNVEWFKVFQSFYFLKVLWTSDIYGFESKSSFLWAFLKFVTKLSFHKKPPVNPSIIYFFLSN